MKFKIVPSTRDGRRQLLTSYLINDTLAIDAGALAIGLSSEEQLRIRSIVITHAHLDHILSLPLYLTDLFDEVREPVNVYATASDFEALQHHLLTDRVWITLETMKNSYTDLIAYHPIKTGESFFAEGLKITPIPVTHTILTHGLIIEDDRSALLFTSDTSATERIWQIAQVHDKLRAVFIDLSFPNRLTDLARVSGHHSPATLLEELPKIKSDVPIFAVHLKAAYRDQVEAEIAALANPRIRIAEVGREYEF
ncbi:MAG: MBL fold metallo-hydrolase [Acidobacteriota bacterium]|nr:MBL fold metallo-hydrolase [Acidobacteriota bacterium]